VCDLAFGLRARIEEWFIRPRAEERERTRKEAPKKVLASRHHRRISLFAALVE
jgi:hypothetical protein